MLKISNFLLIKKKKIKRTRTTNQCSIFFALLWISVCLFAPRWRWAGQNFFFLGIQSRSKALRKADGPPHSPTPIPARSLLHSFHFQCLICSLLILVVWKSFLLWWVELNSVPDFGLQADVIVRGYGGYNTRWALFLLDELFPPVRFCSK